MITLKGPGTPLALTSAVFLPVWQCHYCTEWEVQEVGKETVDTSGHMEVR